MRLRALLFTMCLLASAAAAQQAVYVQLVLDASGSMWTRLGDGRPRIVAAKDVLQDLIRSLPQAEALHVGLRVYGSKLRHTEPSACEDTELLVPMQGVQRDAMARAVRDARALGATPIALSLQAAAEDFPAEGRKLIVLVTDGEESCGGNLHSVAETLRAQGVELQIVGIALDPAAVKRFEPIGRVVNVQDARQLAQALLDATKQAVAPATEPLAVTARVRLQGKLAQGASVRFVDTVDGEIFPLPPAGEPGLYGASLPPGAYVARVEVAGAEPGVQEFSGLGVSPGDDNAFEFDLDAVARVQLDVRPASAEAGQSVTVAFTQAPGVENQEIALGPPGEDGLELSRQTAEGTRGEVELRTPDEPGELEARFTLQGARGWRVIGRSQPFRTTQPTASVQGPASVTAGAPFEVSWTGPANPGDYVTIVEAGAAQGEYRSYADTSQGNPLELRAPEDPGRHELRYVTGQSARTLASAPIEVGAATGGVQGPASVPAGAPFEVSWTGPANPGDYVTIVEAGAEEGAYRNYADTGQGNPLELRAPDESGRYELRYVSGQGGKTLASAPIEVQPVWASLQAPDAVEAGAAVEVTWTGPDHPGDYVTIVETGAEQGSYLSYANTSNGNPLQLEAPQATGRYELRYVTGQSGKTLTSVPIEVR